MAHARSQGGIATYVHPVGVRDPFEPGNERAVPVSLVADGVLGDIDGIEVVCLWTDDLGTSELWYQPAQPGPARRPDGGESDVMSNFYRTMAPGTARAYVRTASDDPEAFFAGLKAGQSFVTTGPVLDAAVQGAGPGGVVEGGRRVTWTAEVASAVPVDRVEVVVNGVVVDAQPGLAEAGRQSVGGTVVLPAAGWVAVRAVGPASGVAVDGGLRLRAHGAGLDRRRRQRGRRRPAPGRRATCSGCSTCRRAGSRRRTMAWTRRACAPGRSPRARAELERWAR